MPKKKKIKIDGGSEETEAAKVIPPEDGETSENGATEAVGDQENKTEPDKVKEMEEKLEAATQESKDNYDRLLRVTAEFENYKKRATREMQDFKKFANQSLIKELLPVIGRLDLEPQIRQQLKQLLLWAEPIKFAGQPATKNRMQRDLSFGRKFVIKTRPAVQEENV